MKNWPMEERVSKTRILMRKKGLDAMIVTAWENLYYLTGVLPIQSKARLSDPLMPLLISAEESKEPIFVPVVTFSRCVKLEHDYIKDVRPHSGAGIFGFSKLGSAWDVVSKSLEEWNVSSKNIGVELKHLSSLHADALKGKMPKAAFRNCTEIVEELRMIKSEDEKAYIEKACKITDDVLEEAQDYLKVGKTEMDVTREVLARCLNHGADGASFYPQMFSGKRAYLLNITSSFEKKIQKEEIVLVDFGAVYKGYGCDTTRVFILGKPNKEQEKAHAATRQIVDECVKAVRPGVKASHIHDVALSKFAEFGYEAIHTTGHGIGLTNWERPYLSPDEQTIIQPNMTMAVEQGVYTPNWGTRLEENLIVTESGVKNLFKFPLDMIEIR